VPSDTENDIFVIHHRQVCSKIIIEQTSNPNTKKTDMSPYFSFYKLLAASLVAVSFIATAMAQTSSASSSDTTSPPPLDGKTEQTLSAGQLAKVKTVLAPYKATSLTPADAKLIKRTLRDAGISPSRALGDAMIATGFDLRRLDELDPPPVRASSRNAK
jgi:hypothetical protein